MNIARLLENAAIRFARRPALTLHGRAEINYGEFARRARVLGEALRKRCRLRPGDPVALVMSNHPAVYELMFAIWHAGLVAVPINPKLHRNEVEYIVNHCGARICFATEDLVGGLAGIAGAGGELRLIAAGSDEYRRLLVSGDGAAMAEVDPTTPAWVFYTSGTTGRPKGAVLTHRNLLAMVLGYFADIDAIDAGDAIIHAAPMSHGSGLYGLPHVARAANNIIPQGRHFDADEIWEIIGDHSGVSMFAAPTMVKRLIASPGLDQQRLAGLKTVIYGGAPMYLADLEAALQALGPRLAQIYGQGESPMTITALSKADHLWRDEPGHAARLGSVGYPRTGVEVQVVDATGRRLPVGESGEVVVRGDVVMSGYLNDAEASSRALRAGWLYTGDIGAFDGEGFLTLKDRSKDVIISGGSNIYPREVEEVLLRHAAVREVSVVGETHPEWGEQVVAFVACEHGDMRLAEELDALCVSNIARFKRPKRYHFLASLPKSDNGKILKSALREQLGESGRAFALRSGEA